MQNLAEHLTDLPEMPDSVHLPTQDDLPCDDGVPMETFRHKRQMDFLIDVLDAWLVERGDGFAGGDMFMYYSMLQTKRNDFIGPDFFVALNVPLGERKSWVSWQEGKMPDVVVELLSESTAKHDKTGKKDIYERVMKVPEYFWYDPWNADDLAGFTLGNGYRPIAPDPEGRLYSARLDLSLGRWEGVYKGIHAVWVRWFTPDGRMLPSADEIAEAATAKAQAATAEAQAATAKAQTATAEAQAATAKAQAATAEAQAATAEAQREKLKAERAGAELAAAQQHILKLAAKLRASGIDPESL